MQVANPFGGICTRCDGPCLDRGLPDPMCHVCHVETGQADPLCMACSRGLDAVRVPDFGPSARQLADAAQQGPPALPPRPPGASTRTDRAYRNAARRRIYRGAHGRRAPYRESLDMFARTAAEQLAAGYKGISAKTIVEAHALLEAFLPIDQPTWYGGTGILIASALEGRPRSAVLPGEDTEARVGGLDRCRSSRCSTPGCWTTLKAARSAGSCRST